MAAVVRLQSDWDQVLRKNEEEAWLSCRIPGKSTLYGTLTCQGVSSDGIPEIIASEGFVVSEITKLCSYLEDDCLMTVTHALVTSRLDFCNALYVGLPLKTVRILQMVQNRAARLLTGTGHYSHITPVLFQLHWLPIKVRAQFKVLVITYKALNSLGPGYLKERLHPYLPSRPLRLAAEALLREPSVKDIRRKSLLVSCPRENASTKFLAPHTTFCRIHPKSVSVFTDLFEMGCLETKVPRVTCLDISSGGGLGVSTSADGTMKIWQAANGEIRRFLAGHVYDVNCCRFFPSGIVVLSGGMDAQLKVWSAEDARCAATFQGHRAGILDTAVVDRGRNVVSSSRDGTARLWDCGKSACLGVVADCGSPVNGIAVGEADNSLNLGSPEKTPSEREVGTEGKLLLLAREDKKLQGVGLQSRQPVFLFVGSDAFNCCAFLSSIYLLGGTQDGNIYQLDVRNTKTPVRIVHRSGAPVFSLLPYKDGFIASQGDGSCFIMQQDLDHVVELTGPDCDPVYKVAVWEKQIYTCCRDSIVRKYQLSDL
ncbi:Proteasomal ATPase-associated factor 1 [Varanus komodoensis]|nr:Proteasomal ATPase-associated factor 1 [Varanus komodoensis]